MDDKAKMQKVFDKVAKHLLTQGRKSRKGDACLYRGPDGLRCAIGALIPDKLYRAEIEGCGVDMLPTRILDYIGARVGFLTSLQVIHDSRRPSEWGGALRKFARDRGLSPAAAE